MAIHKPHRIEITLTETLHNLLSREAERRGQDVSTVIKAALERYAEQFDITHTHTWDLCGAFSVTDGDASELPVTNYAEHVDEVLYTGT